MRSHIGGRPTARGRYLHFRRTSPNTGAALRHSRLSVQAFPARSTTVEVRQYHRYRVAGPRYTRGRSHHAGANTAATAAALCSKFLQRTTSNPHPRTHHHPLAGYPAAARCLTSATAIDRCDQFSHNVVDRRRLLFR